MPASVCTFYFQPVILPVDSELASHCSTSMRAVFLQFEVRGPLACPLPSSEEVTPLPLTIDEESRTAKTPAAIAAMLAPACFVPARSDLSNRSRKLVSNLDARKPVSLRMRGKS